MSRRCVQPRLCKQALRTVTKLNLCMLALKKVKNCLSTCDNSKALTGRLSLKSRRIPLTVLTVSLLTFDARESMSLFGRI